MSKREKAPILSEISIIINAQIETAKITHPLEIVVESDILTARKTLAQLGKERLEQLQADKFRVKL